MNPARIDVIPKYRAGKFPRFIANGTRNIFLGYSFVFSSRTLIFKFLPYVIEEYGLPQLYNYDLLELQYLQHNRR